MKQHTMKPFLITLLVLFAYIASAQHDHSSHDHGSSPEHTHAAEPPHGGEIKDVGKYHLEIVAEVMAAKEKLSVYVLKSNLKTVEIKDMIGKAVIKYPDGTEETLDLMSNGIDKFFCNPKEMIKPFTALITITIKDKPYSCVFNNKGLGK